MSKRIIVLPEELEVIEQRLSKIENVLKHEQHQVEDPILGRRTVQSWRDAGLIEFSAVKSKFYYRMSAINKLLNSNQICCN
jgi:hypothetical protein